MSAYSLAIEERNHGQEVLTAKEIGLEYVPDDGVKNLMEKQESAVWFLAFQKGKIISWRPASGIRKIC